MTVPHFILCQAIYIKTPIIIGNNVLGVVGLWDFAREEVGYL